MAENKLDPNIVGMCTECKSTMRQMWMENNPFAQQGMSPVCPYCGGVVGVIDRRNEDKAKKQMDRERGIDAGQ